MVLEVGVLAEADVVEVFAPDTSGSERDTLQTLWNLHDPTWSILLHDMCSVTTLTDHMPHTTRVLLGRIQVRDSRSLTSPFHALC